MDSITPHTMRVHATQQFGELRSAASAFREGDVLYGRLRPYLNKVWHASFDGACSAELLVVQPRNDLDAGFLAYLLHCRDFVDFASHAVTGDRPRIDFGSMAEFPVPIPPITVQRAIVARINELFCEIDDGEIALARARDDLAMWRKALLKAAVTGELTADWRAGTPPTEAGTDLLALILGHQNSSKIGPQAFGRAKKPRRVKETTAPSDEQKSLMWEPPMGWVWAQLGNIAFVTKLAGFEYTKYVRYADDGDLRVIKAENAGKMGFKRTDFSRVHSSAVADLTRSRLSGGELLMVFVGAGTGNVAMVPKNEEFFLGPNIGMMRIESDRVDPCYVEHFLRSPVGKALATASMKAVAQPSLSMTTIRQIPVLIPPPHEQKLILTKLDNGLGAADDAYAALTEQEGSGAVLRQSILAAAFRGGLVA